MALIDISIGSPFVFALGQTLTITPRGVAGTVVGRGQFQDAENMYLMRYNHPDMGSNIEEWIKQSNVRA